MKIALALLLAAASLNADTHRETTTVEVVQVPVYVNKGDQPVTGLKKDDFELFINGKPQKIDYFDVVDFASPGSAGVSPAREGETAGAAPAPAMQRRLYVLLFDLTYSTMKAIARARVAAAQYVDKAGENDLFSVATFDSVHGIQIRIPFTRDREGTRHAIQKFGKQTQDDPLHLAITPADRAELVSPDRFAEQSEEPSAVDSASQELQQDPLRRLARDQASDLADLADRLAALEGNRHVLMFTGGFNASALHGAGPANTIHFPINFGEHAQIDKPLRQGWSLGASDPGAMHALTEMYRHFTRAGVFLDCIDVEGNRFSMEPYHESEALSTLARDTGGQVILNHNNITEAIETLTEMQRVVYVLGFHARETGKRDNDIKVKLRGGLSGTLTYRPSYSTSVPKSATNDGLRIADIIENDIPQSGVTLTATTRDNTVDVAIPPKEIVALAGGKAGDAEALMYVYEGRNVIAFQQKRIAIDPSQANLDQPLHLMQTFDLPPGDYVAKVLIRVGTADAFGFARTTMTIE
jgi:VWFA-related protein